MKRCAIPTLLVLGVCCCSNANGNGATTGGFGGTTGGTAGGKDAGWAQIPVDSSPGMAGYPIAMAIGPGDQVGLAYFSIPDGGTSHNGQADLQVTYTELSNGAVTVPPQVIRLIQIQTGLTVSFLPDGTPAVGFLGGGAFVYSENDEDGGPPPLGSTYWLQSQPEIAYREPDSGWDQEICMTDSTAGGDFTWTVEASDGTPDTSAMQLVNEGNVVGLWPALVFDGGVAEMAYRDVHFGQFPRQDWGASDVKLCRGGAPPMTWSWSAPMTIDATGNHEQGAYGNHNQMIFGADGALVIVCDSDPNDQGNTVAGGTAGVGFVIQSSSPITGTSTDWTLPIDPFNPTANPADVIGDTETGPVVVYDPSFGYGVAVADLTPGQTPSLKFTSSSDGKSWPATKDIDVVYQLGSGGFFPSMAVDPLSGNPNVAYFICSLTAGVDPVAGNCTVNGGAELDVAVRNGAGNWPSTKVLAAPVFMPKLGFLSTDRRVIAYRDLDTGALSVLWEN